MDIRTFSEEEIDDILLKFQMGISYKKISEVYKTDSLRIKNLLIRYGAIKTTDDRHTATVRRRKVKGVPDIVYEGVQMYDWTKAFMDAWDNGEDLIRRK